MNMKKNPAAIPPYYQVVTQPNGAEADILLYGVIGQRDWWSDDNEESITDLEFIKTLRDLEAKYSKINIRINSPGGSTFHGFAIVAAMRASKAEIHTYVDGMAASMSAMIWLAGSTRHVNPGSLVMLHSVRTVIWDYMTASALRKEADTLDKLDESAISMLAACTGLAPDAVKSTYFDGDDHWLTAADCATAGFVAAVEDYKVEKAAVPKDAKDMSMRSLMEFYMKTDDPKQPSDWLSRLTERLRAAYTPEVEAPIISPTQQISPDMKKDELTAALADGSLSVADLQAAIAQAKPAEVVAEKPLDEPKKEDEELKAKFTKLEADLEAAQAEIKKLGAKPGDDVTVIKPNAQLQDLSPELKAKAAELQKFNEEMAGRAATYTPAGYQTEV
jgi:ATP-dependent Clp protease, protease subunit